jgi:hypothetical protein
MADLFVHVCDEALVRDTLGPGFRGRIVQSIIAQLPWHGATTRSTWR